MDNPKQLLDIKSPVFTPKPGWGGKLKKWLSRHQARLAQWAARHFRSSILPLISLLAVVLGLYLTLFK